MRAKKNVRVRARGARALARWSLLGAVVVLLGAGCVRTAPELPPPPVPMKIPEPPREVSPTRSPSAQTKVIDLASTPGVHPAFAVQLTVPSSWEVEVVPEIEAVNFYDPAAPGVTPREQSQIFLRHFRAGEFLTLSTVTVVSRTPGVVAGRPAVAYIIEKKPGVAPFPHQPAWRSSQHRVTDVRLSDQSPSEFLVFGKRPELPDGVFDRVLESLQPTSALDTSLVPPARDFFSAITEKPFGLFITPETSPVQPERFRGYHTGADAELPAGTLVTAIADGHVLRSGRTSGYGGLVVIEHAVAGERVVSLSGHLDPGTLVAVGSAVRRGQRIGVLGDAFSAETDGARAHLHFGIYRGPGVDVVGYVSARDALGPWHDPVEFLRAHGGAR